MRVNITVYISEGGYTYSREGQVNREAVFEAQPESLKVIPWGVVLGGLVESGISEFLYEREGETVGQEGGPSMRDDMDDPDLGVLHVKKEVKNGTN